MKKYTLFVGLNDKDSKIQKINIVEAYKIVENLLLSEKIEGFTIHQAQGVYKHEDGVIVKENSLIIYVYDFSDSLYQNIIMAINNIKKALNQESIALETNVIESTLI